MAGVRPADASQAAAHRAQDPRPPAVRDGLRRGVLHDPTVREAVEAGQPGAFGRILQTGWIGNGVLDGFLEDESLFGEFLRTPVSEGGVEPLVVGPPHAVVGVMPRLLDRGVVVPVHELLLQQPVRRFDHGVVVGVALVRQRPFDVEHVERLVDPRVVELAAPVGAEHLDVPQREVEGGERAQHQARVPCPPGGVFCQALVCRFTVDGCPGYRSIVYRVTVGWFRLVLVVLLLHEGVGPAVGFALEPDHASVVDGAVDDRGGHVGVAEHASPSAGLDVRGVDDALGLVRVGHDLEQESAAFLVYGHVAELVDDDHAGLGDGLQFPVEFAFRVGAQEPHDQARGGVEPHRHALPAGLPAQRDGEVGLAGAGRPEHDHVLRTVEESEGFEPAALPVRRHAHVLPVVVVEFLGGGEAGLSGQARAFGRLPGFDLGVHPPVHELHLGRGRGFELVGEHLPGQWQPAGQTHDLVHFPVRGRAAAGRVRHRCVPFAHAHAAFAWVSGRMNLSYACRSGAGTSSGVSPALTRLAMAVRLASSIEWPCSTMCSPAFAAASKPYASLALARRRNVRWRVLESMASIARRSFSGKSPRMGDSPHARDLRAKAGSGLAGFLTVWAALPYARGSLATNLPSCVRISTPNARNPTSRFQPCHEGPARYLSESISTLPSRSALRVSQRHES